MEAYIIDGGRRLFGEIRAGGSKNACLPVLAAAVLLRDKCIIDNCPQISDVKHTIKLLENTGCKISQQKHRLTIEPPDIPNLDPDTSDAVKMRSSCLFLGALLGRYQKAVLPLPGGCRIGKRPIDLHLDALRAMGAQIYEDEAFIYADCKEKRLKGANINLPFPSVGATENIILAAVLAEGTTLLYGAAREPEIVFLADFLNSAGAKIYGAGGSAIEIEGVDALKGTECTIPPDRIEAGTLLCAAAATGGEIYVNNARPDEMRAQLDIFERIGCTLKLPPKGIYIRAPKRPKAISGLITGPYPAFPTDMQPQLTSVLTRALGTSMIIETMFESRFHHIRELVKTGADITLLGDRALIKGVDGLFGCENLVAGDLRGGAALILAALSAEGRSKVFGAEYVERGYEAFEKKLAALGAE
ncbi:MAG: UDP-N-acetylglucosamine 1-carboxyvinyltransferase, partial [Firmicutes bacterium]|nr:UDP-N-acetylglucosamine 1-carboxyvinyltransferase [Bacillota bacterium]